MASNNPSAEPDDADALDRRADALESWAAHDMRRGYDTTAIAREIDELRARARVLRDAFPTPALPRAPWWREAWDGLALVAEWLWAVLRPVGRRTDR